MITPFLLPYFSSPLMPHYGLYVWTAAHLVHATLFSSFAALGAYPTLPYCTDLLDAIIL